MWKKLQIQEKPQKAPDLRVWEKADFCLCLLQLRCLEKRYSIITFIKETWKTMILLNNDILKQ